jgi:hypothetical protein
MVVVCPTIPGMLPAREIRCSVGNRKMHLYRLLVRPEELAEFPLLLFE